MTLDNSAMTDWHFSNFSKSGHLLKLLKLLKCQSSHCWNVNQSSKIVILTYVDIVWCLWEMIMKSLLHFGALALRENVTSEKNLKHFETQWKSRKIIVSNPIRSKTIVCIKIHRSRRSKEPLGVDTLTATNPLNIIYIQICCHSAFLPQLAGGTIWEITTLVELSK